MFFPLSLCLYSRWQFRRSGFWSAYAFPPILLLSQHTRVITQTRSQSHTHSYTAGEFERHRQKQAQDTFSFSLLHRSAHILANQTRHRSYEINTQAVNDWPQQVCVHRLAALSLNVLSGLALRLPAGPLLHYTGHHIKALTLWKPGYASKYHLFTSCTHATHSHQPTHA